MGEIRRKKSIVAEKEKEERESLSRRRDQ